jgi:hypothetical protein
MHDIFENSLNPGPPQSEENLETAVFENWGRHITLKTEEISLSASNRVIVTE